MELLKYPLDKISDKSKNHYISRLQYLIKKSGFICPLKLFEYIKIHFSNCFTQRTYLQSLIVYKESSKELSKNIYEFCNILRHQGYKNHNKYKISLTIPEVIEKVKNTYIENSKERILLLIFCEWPLRDNIPNIFHFKEDLEVENLKNNQFPNYNFMYIDSNEKVHVVICKSKTVPKYFSPIDKQMSEDFQNNFKNFIIDNKADIFGIGNKIRNSKLISKLFKKCGVEQGCINLLRRLHRRDALNSGNVEIIKENALLSFHNLKTANDYNF